MKRVSIVCLVLGAAAAVFIPATGQAGSRPYDLAFADVSASDVPEVGKHLAELIRKDLATALDSGGGATEVTALERPAIEKLFGNGCAVVVKDPARFHAVVSAKAQDGLIAYCYDDSRREVVLAYLRPDGAEIARVVFKVQSADPMKGSLLRHQRRASLRALETAMDFVP